MGEHLKGKQQGLIRQRFENYLQITRTLQNDIGKLAALTCELRLADHHGSAALADRESSSMRVSISCNEDGTFVVYTVPDAAGVLGSQCMDPGAHLKDSDMEFWKQADAAQTLHKDLVRKYRLRQVQSSGDKASEIWTAYGSLEELLEGMEQRYLELCQANDTEDEPLGERSDDSDGHRHLVDSLQQRLLDQQMIAQKLREDLSAQKLEEERAQEAEVKLLAEAKVFEASVEEHQENDHENASVLPTGDDSKTEGDLQSQWVHKVCEFGMSGRCHSLTALFHFGYTTWKQLMHGTQSAWGMESVEDVSPGHIAEEEQIQEVPKEEGLLPEAEQSKGWS
eukprot:symbB.v1.2.022911.t1/scaffold2052.1/size91004/6